MSDSSIALNSTRGENAAQQARDFLPGQLTPAGVVADLPPLPWPGLTKADCVLWAIALHRAAVAARLAGGQTR